MFQENKIETCILSRVKQITSPGWMHETSAQAWCTGKTQRDWVEREVGTGIRMGNTCISKADSCQCMKIKRKKKWLAKGNQKKMRNKSDPNYHQKKKKESACTTRDPGLILGSGRSPREGNGYPLQYSCLENSLDRGAYQATIHGSQWVRHDWATKHSTPII